MLKLLPLTNHLSHNHTTITCLRSTWPRPLIFVAHRDGCNDWHRFKRSNQLLTSNATVQQPPCTQGVRAHVLQKSIVTKFSRYPDLMFGKHFYGFWNSENFLPLFSSKALFLKGNREWDSFVARRGCEKAAVTLHWIMEQADCGNHQIDKWVSWMRFFTCNIPSSL